MQSASSPSLDYRDSSHCCRNTAWTAKSLKWLAVTEPFWRESEPEDRGVEGHKQAYVILNLYVPLFFVSPCSLSVCIPVRPSQSLTFWLDTADYQQPWSPVGIFLDLQYSVVGSSSPLATVKVVDSFDRRMFKTSPDMVCQPRGTPDIVVHYQGV